MRHVGDAIDGGLDIARRVVGGDGHAVDGAMQAGGRLVDGAVQVGGGLVDCAVGAGRVAGKRGVGTGGDFHCILLTRWG